MKLSAERLIEASKEMQQDPDDPFCLCIIIDGKTYRIDDPKIREQLNKFIIAFDPPITHSDYYAEHQDL